MSERPRSHPALVKYRASLAILLLASTVARADSSETFRIHDHLDPLEIDEITSIYVDGQLIATFRLSAENEHESVDVTVPKSESHIYALCGRITFREIDGSVATHEVSSSGTIYDAEAREYDAVASNDFTVFYLRDITEGRPPGEVQINRVRSCTAPVASR